MTSLPSLFDLSAAARQIRDRLDAADDERTPGAEAALALALASVDGGIAAKVDTLLTIAAELAAEEKALAEYAARFQEKALAAGRKNARILADVTTYLRASGLEKVKGARWTASLQQNPSHVEVLDELLVPEVFWREKTSRSVDKVAVRDAVKGGAVVPGAALVPGAMRLVIR